MYKLNNSGIAHFLALALLVVGASTFGTYQLVAKRNIVSSNIKPNIALLSGARLDGTPPGEYSELQVQSKATIIVRTTVQNLDQIRADKLVFKNSLPGGLTLVPGSLTVNGVPVKSSPRSVGLGPLESKAIHDISYKAVVKASSASCDKIIVNTVSITSGGVTAATEPIKLTVCGKAAETKVKPALSLRYGAHGEGQGAVGLLQQLVVRPGSRITFTAEVTNTSAKAVQNVSVNINGFTGTALVAEPGSLAIDGYPTRTELLSKVRIGILEPQAKKTITFTGLVRASDKKFCGDKKINTKAIMTASGVPSQQSITSLELC